MPLEHVFYLYCLTYAYENAIDDVPLNYYNSRTYAGPAHVTLQDPATNRRTSAHLLVLNTNSI